MPCYDSYTLSLRENIGYYLISGFFLAVVGYLFYHSLLCSILLIALSHPGKKVYLAHKVEKRKTELSHQFRDLLYSLSASFATGRQMKEALEEAEEGLQLIYDRDTPICLELSHMIRLMKESKESEEELLKDFAFRSGIADIRNFVDLYIIGKKTGGNMVKVVIKTTNVLLDKIDIQLEIHKLTAQKKLESYIITALPFLVILFLKLSSPNYLNVLYETLLGRVLMTMALIIILIAYLWSMKLTKIEI